MASFTHKSKKYELPAKTLKLVEAEDVMLTDSKTLMESYTKQFEYLKALFDDEKLVELFGTSDINEVDLTEVVVVNNLIDDAYMEKINKQKLEEMEKLTNSSAVEKAIKLGNAVDKSMKIKENKNI